jgi:DNA-binding MarR family transcriptional regulator
MCLPVLLKRFFAWLASARLRLDRGERIPLTPKQQAALALVRLHPDWSQRRLAAMIGITQPALCWLLRRARDRANATDRREARQLADAIS